MLHALCIAILLIHAFPRSALSADQQYEFCNNFLMNLSFVTGTDRGMAQNLDDNFGWMQDQGYTHLRFFGIFPNRVHCFPSPTLDANGYPRSPYHEPVLELLASKAQEHNIVVNFDGWEVIAEANYDTAAAGVGYITPEEIGDVVEEVLALGINLISEEQFGSAYLQQMQSVCAMHGAAHETTAALWWQSPYASLIADMQLANAFTFYPYSQDEADSIISAGTPYTLHANIGALHFMLEGCRYFNVPTSVAVGSFGTLNPENWANVLRFVQIEHAPERFSIEEQNTSFTIWNSSFNFMDYVGNDLQTMADMYIGDRPIVNLVINAASVASPSFLPAWYASLIDGAPIVNTFASDGYRVVATVDTLLPEADAYYLLLAGGPGAPNIADLPDYVPSLLEGTKPVFVQPTYGIPDGNDGGGWEPLRSLFGLPSGETETIANAIPETVDFGGFDVKWRGVSLYLTPCIELLRTSEIDTSHVTIPLSGTIGADDIALMLKSGNKYLINSNLINITSAYVLSQLLSGSINRPSIADIVVANDKCLIFAEYDTDVDVTVPWNGTSRLMIYDSFGYSVADKDTLLAGRYAAAMSRGELVILIGSSGHLCGDASGEGSIDIDDVVYLIAYIFSGGPAPEPIEAGDTDCSGGIDIDDVVYLIAYIFSGGPAPCADCP